MQIRLARIRCLRSSLDLGNARTSCLDRLRDEDILCVIKEVALGPEILTEIPFQGTCRACERFRRLLQSERLLQYRRRRRRNIEWVGRRRRLRNRQREARKGIWSVGRIRRNGKFRRDRRDRRDRGSRRCHGFATFAVRSLARRFTCFLRWLLWSFRCDARGEVSRRCCHGVALCAYLRIAIRGESSQTWPC